MGEGESLRSICRDDAMPALSTVSGGWRAIESFKSSTRARWMRGQRSWRKKS
jgi:hypothetical protein